MARLLDDNDGDEKTAAAIAEALGDLPVAVAQAAATIRDNRYTFKVYLLELKNYPISDVVTRVEGEDYPDAVGSALRVAYRSALKRITSKNSKQGEIAEAQLGALSLLAASGVPERWLTPMDGGSPRTRRALTALVDASVCERSEDGTRVRLHRLQAQVIREDWAAGSEAGARATEAAVTVLAAVDITSRESFEEQRREALDLAEQLRTVAAWEDRSGQDPWGLFSDPRTAWTLAHAIKETSELGAPQEALSLADAVDLCATALGDDHDLTLACRNNLASAYRGAGRLDEAIDLSDRTLSERERVLGPDHPDTLVTRNNLAGAYQDAGRLDEAIDLF
ncbi:tetratricopeptide repeat protein [Actinomyces howellii]|uniref:Predicted O-linked N-acetylglucosamine transferase, SPINDLY family n=1 Tax=Actinomyces howellii TaxID=52771 RepID=A0A3S4R2H7_9ACTO|nr:tetratricopeptide repeat protein [Actinomyces howellii]VEG29944.1 Predicted O-linked N-acetylglucosamine transferase, SPINDLY family [Actinomyces howellii]